MLPDGHKLRGKIAVANAKVAYEHFNGLFFGNSHYGMLFEGLRQAGARVQRPLWASTGTKNSAYSDVLYVDSLIGPNTVNTVPQETLIAFRDHGTAAFTLASGFDTAHATLIELAELGIDLSAITVQLQKEGVNAFTVSFLNLLSQIEKKLVKVQQADHLA